MSSINPGSQGITGCVKSLTITYITDLPPSKKKELCEHCDQIDVWMQMATKMGFSDNDIEVKLKFLFLEHFLDVFYYGKRELKSCASF